jgi:hypothetical protein
MTACEAVLRPRSKIGTSSEINAILPSCTQITFFPLIMSSPLVREAESTAAARSRSRHRMKKTVEVFCGRTLGGKCGQTRLRITRVGM